MSVQEIASLASAAKQPSVFGFADLAEALRVGSQLVRLSGETPRAEFYLRFASPISLEETHALRDLSSEGIRILWDPDVTRNTALIGGAQYALEKGGLRSLESARVRFDKAGFFGVTRAKVARAQRLRESSGLAAVLILEREEGRKYPMFLATGVLPHDLRSGDTVEASYLSVVGERTLAGSPAPTEVFLEALTVELLHSSPSHPPLPWVSARENIDRAISDFEPPPAGGSKRMEAWKKAATVAVTSSLRKGTLYMDWDDERYMHGEIERKAVDAAKHQTGMRQQGRRPT